MRDVLIGQTDYTVLVKIVSTTGAPVTGLAHTDIDIAYSRVETDNDVTTSDVSPADLANLTAAHSDWGWEEVSSTDHPGLYRLDIADAVFASGAWEAVVTITDASGTDFYAVDIGFRLVSFNVQDGVRLGLTALPNAAADAAGGLPISDAGGLDLDTLLARLDAAITTRLAPTTAGRTLDVTATGAAGVDWGNVENPTTTVGLSGTTVASATATGSVVGNVGGNVNGNVVGAVGTVAANGISAASFAADVDAEILSYLVDDATRIDASALNTASGAIGSNGSGLTEAGGTGDQFTALPPVTLANGAHGGTAASLRLGGTTSTPPLYITNSGGAAGVFEGTGSTHDALQLTATGTGTGLNARSTGGGRGARFTGETNGMFIESTSSTGANAGLYVRNRTAGGWGAYLEGGSRALSMEGGVDTVRITGNLLGSGNVRGIYISGKGTGEGVLVDAVQQTAISIVGGSTSGAGITISATSGDGISVNTITVSGAITAGTNAIPWNAAWDTEVQSEVQDAIEANNLDHLAGTATGIPAIPAGTYLDQIMDDGTATYDRTTDSLQAIRDRGDAAWTGGGGGGGGATAEEVWEYATRTLTSTGTITVISPMVQGGSFVIVQGDDYDADESRSIDWTFTSAPSLTGATVRLTAKLRGQDDLSKVLTVIDSDSVRLELTAAETALLEDGDWKFTIQATLSNSRVVTLLLGSMRVIADPS